MKKLLFAFIGLVAMTSVLEAQFVAGPQLKSFLTPSPFTVASESAFLGTNIPAANRLVVPLSGNPAALWIVAAATNATSANLSNISCQFQVSADQVHWHGPLADGWLARNLNIKLAGIGGTVKGAYTNILTGDQVSPWRYMRLYSISNFAGSGDFSNTYYITNLALSQRP